MELMASKSEATKTTWTKMCRTTVTLNKYLYYNYKLKPGNVASRQKKYENLVVCACWERWRGPKLYVLA